MRLTKRQNIQVEDKTHFIIGGDVVIIFHDMYILFDGDPILQFSIPTVSRKNASVPENFFQV